MVRVCVTVVCVYVGCVECKFMPGTGVTCMCATVVCVCGGGLCECKFMVRVLCAVLCVYVCVFSIVVCLHMWYVTKVCE